MPKDTEIDERELAKNARRALVCFEACRGLPTEGLEKIAKLEPSARPMALATLAMRRASN